MTAFLQVDDRSSATDGVYVLPSRGVYEVRVRLCAITRANSIIGIQVLLLAALLVFDYSY